MKNKKYLLIFLLSAVMLSAGCQSPTDNQNSSLPVYSKPETSTVVSDTESSSEQGDAQSSKENLNDEARKIIRDKFLTLITSFSAEESNYTVEYYTKQIMTDEDTVPWYDADYFIEKDADGNVLRITDSFDFARAEDCETYIHPQKYILMYNNDGRYAHIYRYSMNEELPKLYIYNDIDGKEAYGLVGCSYDEEIDLPETNVESSSDGLPENVIEDLDVLLISKDPYIAYEKSDLIKDSDGFYVVDSVRLVDLEKFNISYNEIDSVKNADEFDNNKRYWGEKKLYECENSINDSDEQFLIEMKAGSEVGPLTIRSCYTCYGDGVYKENEDSDKYYNHVSPVNKQEIVFDGEVTLKGYAILENGNEIVFSPYASSFAEAFRFAPSYTIYTEFAITVPDMIYIEDNEHAFAYTCNENNCMDITGSSLSADDFKDKFVSEVLVTIKNPELFYNKSGAGMVQSGLYGTILSVEKIRDIF